MSIGILYERSGTDETGIRMAAEELGIDLVFLPFRKVAVCLNEGGMRFNGRKISHSDLIRNVQVILNRAQSKNRRLVAADLFETLGKYVLNSSIIEYTCFSKLRTILRFWKDGIDIPKTVYIPCDSCENLADGSKIWNETEIADLTEQELGSGNVVVKPDAGTHGKDVRLAHGRNDLLAILRETESSIINPIGVLAQRFVQKWFYDLRILVAKERGKQPHCFQSALARGGFKDFRTNTFLGNMIFGVDLPTHIRNVAVKCGKAISNNSQAWVIALDAMIDHGEVADDEYVRSELQKLEPAFENIKRVKADKTRSKDFKCWNTRLEKAFQCYKDQGAYSHVKEVIGESMERNQHKILFHEANSCPEFWEQTRLIAGVNLAVPLLKCAESMLEANHGVS